MNQRRFFRYFKKNSVLNIKHSNECKKNHEIQPDAKKKTPY